MWRWAKRWGWTILVAGGAVVAWLLVRRWRPNSDGTIKDEVIAKIAGLRETERKAQERAASKLALLEAKHAAELARMEDRYAAKLEKLRADPDAAVRYLNRQLARLRARRRGTPRTR